MKQGFAIKWAGVALGVAGLGACVNLGGGAKAPAQLFELSPAMTWAPGTTLSAAPGAALVVVEPETDRSLAVARVAVQVDATSMAYLKDGQWVERPARLFRSLLAETIRARGKRLVVEDDAEARGNLHLSGRLIALGYDAHNRSAVVRYDALWQDASGAIAMRRFEAVEKNVAPKATAVAPALNRAANRVAADVADWVK